MADHLYEPDMEHELKNQLAIISGYCELLLDDIPGEDPHHADLLEIRKAVAAALELIRRERSG